MALMYGWFAMYSLHTFMPEEAEVSHPPLAQMSVRKNTLDIIGRYQISYERICTL